MARARISAPVAFLVATVCLQGALGFLGPKLPTPGAPYSDTLMSLLSILEKTGMPGSYDDRLPNGTLYWLAQTYLGKGAFDAYGNQIPLGSQEAIQERTLTHEGLNLYDGATWQIALSLWGLTDAAFNYEQNVLYTSTTGPGQFEPPVAGNGEIIRVYGIGQGIPNIRADTKDFTYGTTKGPDLMQIPNPGNVSRFPFDPYTGAIKEAVTKAPGSLYYRMIGPNYFMKDPLNGFVANSWKSPYPVTDKSTAFDHTGYIHWNDWKPITGENVWGTMIGPLQRLHKQTNGTMGLNEKLCGLPENYINCDYQTYDTVPGSVQLGISILPALKAMKSSLGAIFHCPGGTALYPVDPHEAENVSNENNFSAYGALKMLQEVLKKAAGTSDQYLTFAISTVDELVSGLDNWFDNHLLPTGSTINGAYLIPQGGHVIDGVYKIAPLDKVGGIAADCQTWGMTVLGADRIDSKFGAGTAYDIWQTTKKYVGFHINGELAGIGYTANATDPNSETTWSAEWTFGAINMAQVLAGQYGKSGDATKAASLMADAVSMNKHTTAQWPMGLKFSTGGYVYSNNRFFIPWGWYANPVTATCSSAWGVMNAANFNPFVLGGGDKPSLDHMF